MLKEITDAVEASRALDVEKRADWARSDAWSRGRTGFAGVILDLAEDAKISKEFARDCAELMDKLSRRQITQEDFQRSMDLLDQAVRASTNQGICSKGCIDGYLYEPFLQRCTCLVGQRLGEKIFGPARPDGAREVVNIPSVKV